MGRPIKEKPKDKICPDCKNALPQFMFRNQEWNINGICNKCARKEKRKKYNKENPKKHGARQIVTIALRSGHLIKGLCHVCSTSENIDAHHPDYENPLDVIWLCKKCHAKEHVNIRKNTIESVHKTVDK